MRSILVEEYKDEGMRRGSNRRGSLGGVGMYMGNLCMNKEDAENSFEDGRERERERERE